MKKGSITVFLSLILVLLFSFLLTTLEAARIRGGTAYLSMLSEMAGDSMLAAYYYPLFQHYRLFGVNAGDQEGFFSEDYLKEGLETNLCFGTEELSGGILRFLDSSVSGLEYETMLTGEKSGFFSQIKEQAVLDGLSLALENLFSEEQFKEAGVVGTVYREQEEAMAVTATVTEEVLKLMELADGVRMSSQGIVFDAEGKIQTNRAFIKQLVTMEQGEVKAAYDNAEIFRVLSADFYRADRVAQQLLGRIAEIQQLEKDIALVKSGISNYQEQLVYLKESYRAAQERLKEEKEADTTELLRLLQQIQTKEKQLAAEKDKKSRYEEKRDKLFKALEPEYRELKNKLEAVQKLLQDALEVTGTLEKKQQAASVAVESYAAFLEQMQPSLSETLYQVFSEELEKMKVYAGLEEGGFSIEVIQKSLRTNRELLRELELPEFSKEGLGVMADALRMLQNRMGEYTVEGLWFPYGEIRVTEQRMGNVTGFLSELLTTGILSLVGISKEEQSDCALSGEALPSAGLYKGNRLEELWNGIGEVQQLFRSGAMGEVLSMAKDAVMDGTALELYSMKYFHSYGEEASDTRLHYEREYLVFGNKKDKDNLLSMVLYLVAIRTLFSMVMILKQPERMTQLESLSVSVAGFTGIPVLVAAIKYGVLLLWSVEEALVEVAALLKGKRVAVIGTGNVSFYELCTLNRTVIEKKAEQLLDGRGAAYGDYLALISLTRDRWEKAYRAMDLIQENIRFRYNDSFRMRNVVIQLSFSTNAVLQPLFDTGMFPDAVYRLESRKENAY